MPGFPTRFASSEEKLMNDTWQPKRRLLRALAPALAGLAAGLAGGPAAAAPAACTAAALNALAIPRVTVEAAAPVPAAPPNPAYCFVAGVLQTTGEGAPDGAAQFNLQLPATWNGKFLCWGVGGLAGSTYADFAANPVDFYESLAKGYATAITDTGHQAGATDAAWALDSTGQPDQAKITDYYHRATHQVTLAAKALVSAYYGGSIRYAYFDGCSNGGRQAMVEATRYPQDYDGIVAGAPFFDVRSVLAGTKFQKVQLASPEAYIPASLLPVIDQAVYDSCDAADGVADGLIQNPARCSFDATSLVCKAGASSNCLSPAQANTLNAYIGALRDEYGRLIYTGASITDLHTGDVHSGGMDAWSTGFVPPTSPGANEPWGGTGFSPAPVAWQFVDHIQKYLVERNAGYDLHNFDVSVSGVVHSGALALFDARTEAADGDRPRELTPFLEGGRKLLMFHGFSDPALPPFRTIKYYEDLARGQREGFRGLQEHVRLFMVPGMQHCVGGPGPNSFDTLGALEAWAESGVAPDSLEATHYVGNDPTLGVDRTMPLCKFPEQAQYSGSGDVHSAANWHCTANDRLLEIGANGRQAGLGER